MFISLLFQHYIKFLRNQGGGGGLMGPEVQNVDHLCVKKDKYC